jgi:hypothetical protein
VILRGSIRGGGGALASYLLTKGDNEFVQVFDIRGTSQQDNLRKSLVEMSLTSELSGRTKKGLYHVVINPRPEEARTMTIQQWYRAAEIIEQKRGFTGQKRVMVLHEAKGRLHMHVVWERYNHDTGLMICNRNSHRHENSARRIMEREFGHKLIAEKNAERPALRRLLADLWQQQPTGKGFLKEAASAGYTIARQKGRRPYVIINSKGRSFELVKEIPKIRTRQVRERLKGLFLPDKNEIIDAIRDQQNSRHHNKTREQIAIELKQNLTRDTQKSKSRGR